MNFKNTFIFAVGVYASHLAMATSCMVVGEKTTKIQTSVGEKSPVFLASDCASLRIISGKAMVSWVSKDGKVNFVPIGANGPERQPAVGSEERSANVVWAELTSTRQTRRPAFMRTLGDEKAVSFYVPEAGILIKPQAGTTLKIFSVDEGRETLLMDSKQAQPLLITRDLMKPGLVYALEWNKDGNLEKEKWKMLSEVDSMRLDIQYKEVDNAGLDKEQHRIVIAMLFEQLKLLTNMRILLLIDSDN